MPEAALAPGTTRLENDDGISLVEVSTMHPARHVPKLPPEFPSSVRIAGYLWILIGGLSIMATALGVASAEGSIRPVGSVGCLVSIALIYVGWLSVSGRNTDPLWNGIGALFLGCVNLAVAGFVSLITSIGLGMVLSMPGWALILSGVLALVGRSAYREWRKAEKLAADAPQPLQIAFPNPAPSPSESVPAVLLSTADKSSDEPVDVQPFIPLQFVRCPSCGKRVVAKADGTCPSCQAVLKRMSSTP